MMRKIFSILLSVILVCLLVACNTINCQECGEDIENDALFCSFCGASLSDEKLGVDKEESVSEVNTSTNTKSDTTIVKGTTTEKTSETTTVLTTKETTTKNQLEGYERCEKCSVWFEGDFSYCQNCKCLSSRCKNIKSENSDKYCSEHMCFKTGCLGMKEEGSLYCQNDNCDAPNCKEAKANRARYCQYHKCGECYDQKEEGSDYCKSHNCSGPNCKAERCTGSGYCIAHKCFVNGCSNNGNYTIDGINWCSNHKPE